MVDIALKLEGLPRHASTHAAGVVIGDRPLHELVPLYRDPAALMQSTQFNMKDVEKAGLVKFDFLGLSTLTMLRLAEDLVRARGGNLGLADLPLEDPATYELLTRAETTGVFQLESPGMRDALRKLKPDSFGDIIALVSLYRPGPMDNIPRYTNVKHGIEDPQYLHPLLKPILEETNGVIIYQEQVMEIAKQLAGYTLGGADLLRRAMGKKIKAEMDAQREISSTAAPTAASRRTWPPPSSTRSRSSPLRLQQEPRRGLRAAGLPDRLPEGEPPGRVLRRRDDDRDGEPRQAGLLPPGDAPARRAPLPARRERVLRPLHGRGRAAGPGRPLRPGRDQGRGRGRRAAARRRARGRRPVRLRLRAGRADGPALAQPAPAREPGPRRRLRRLHPAGAPWSSAPSRSSATPRPAPRAPPTRAR
jgi:hypothetical protein